MSTGKYLSLEEARRSKRLSQFAKEHESEGNEEAFDRLFRAMASGKPSEGNQTSTAENDED